MNLGMPTLIELEDLEENVKLCKELGLKFIELNMNMPSFQPEQLDSHYLEALQSKYNIYFTIHLPEDLDVGHFNKRIREANLGIIEDTIHIATQIQAPIINMHMNSGIYFTLPTKKVELYDKYQEEYLKNIIESTNRISEMLKNTPTKLAIENTGIYNRTFIIEAVSRFLEYDGCVLTWDAGHDYSSNRQDESFMTKHIEKIKHMHIHDAIGIKNHLELYTGEIDLDYFFNHALQNECSIVIETKTVEALQRSMHSLRERTFML